MCGVLEEGQEDLAATRRVVCLPALSSHRAGTGSAALSLALYIPISFKVIALDSQCE